MEIECDDDCRYSKSIVLARLTNFALRESIALENPCDCEWNLLPFPSKFVETDYLASLALDLLTIELIFKKIDLNPHDSIEFDELPFHESLLDLFDVFSQ